MSKQIDTFHNLQPPACQRGISLVELMISLLISLLILAGLVTVFSLNRATYQTDEGMARLQENGRFALDFLTRDVHVAGSIGCFAVNQLKTKGNSDDSALRHLNDSAVFQALADLNRPVVGFDASAITAVTTTYTLPTLYPPTVTNGTNPAIPPMLLPATGVVVGSDAMQIVAMDAEYTPILALPSLTTVVVAKDSPIMPGDIVVSTSCDANKGKPALGTVLSSTPSGLNRTLTLDFPVSEELASNGVAYLPLSQIARVRTLLYYIGTGANGGPSLFVRSLTDAIGTPQELVEGIENMQLQYGIEDSACVTQSYRTACQYQPAAAITNPQQIRSVRIGLLVATSNVASARDLNPAANPGATDLGQDNNTYTMQGINFIPNADRHRRHVFETTIQIRNLGINKS